MAPLIRAVLSKLIGDEEAQNIEIVANDADVDADGKWEIKYRHPTSGYGHDKSQAILPYRALPNPPTVFFFGDGVSGAYTYTYAVIGLRAVWFAIRALRVLSNFSSRMLLPVSMLDFLLRVNVWMLTFPTLDMSAARHADVLFVKKKPGMDNDLAAYCTREGIPHILFEDFGRALGVVQEVVEGKLTVKDALALGTA